MFFEKTGPVWDTLCGLEKRLDDAQLNYLVIGGLALNAYDYPRQTINVDIVLTADDFERFKSEFADGVYRRTPGLPRRFVDPSTDVPIDVLIAGQLAGQTQKNKSVRFPDPGEMEVHADLRTVLLARLIKLKLVTWRFKDWGDMVELIRRNQLPESFADGLDPIVRPAFGECWDQANDKEYEGPTN